MNIRRLAVVLLLLNTALFSESPIPLSQTLQEKHSFGLEFNPIRPLLLKTIDVNSLSGGVNYFDDRRGLEIAIPFTFNKMMFNNNFRENDYDDTSFTLDLHLRKFLKNEARGVYLGAFGRYTYLEGRSKNSKIAKLHRFGLGTEVGARLREKGSPIYWGMSLGAGIYLDNNQNIFEHEDTYLMSMDGRKYFWDIELFKWGYEF